MSYVSPETIAALKVAILQNRLKHFVEIIERLAVEQGNAVAAEAFGDMLMSGLWDTKKMEMDRIRDQLEPEDSNDPYLVLPRDPLRAVIFYEQAAKSSGESDAKKRAQAKLTYLQKRGLAGFKNESGKGSVINLSKEVKLFINLSKEVKLFLDTNAKSYSSSGSGLENGHFVPLPDVRPPILDSNTDLFRHLAITMRNRCLFQIFIAEFIALLGFFHSYWSNAYLLLGCVTVAISLPLAIFAVINQLGFLEGKPVCDCAIIVNAYELSVKHLPQDCRKEGNPFETTASYIRLCHFMKILLFWFYIVVSAFRVFLLALNFRGYLIWLGHLDSWNPKGVFFITVPINFLILSIAIVFWDKKVALLKYLRPNSEQEENEEGPSVDVPITILISVFAEDWDCKRELERVSKRRGLHSHVQELEKQNNPPVNNNE